MCHKPIRLMFLSAVPLLGTGCISFLGPEDLRLAISLSQGVGLDREFGVSVDGLTIAAVSAFAPVSIPVGAVTWADVGVYKVRGPKAAESFVFDIELPGWEPVVRTRDGGNEAVVLVKQGRSSIRGFLVFAHDEEELVIVRIKGKIDKLFEHFLEQNDFQEKGWPALADFAMKRKPPIPG